MKLKTKFLCLIAVLLAVSLGANLVWTSANKHAQMENELREQARALAQQMDAVWEFMVANQDRLAQVAFTEDGVYQGLHCAIAGRIIGQSFTMHSDYTTRFVNFNPRNKAGEPDGYEAAALSAFHDDASRADYYGFTDYEGRQVFRYVAPMTIEEACLQCHGEPAGELDVTGAPKEGWKMGDVGGAISIIMPLDVYQANERESVAQDVLFFAIMLAVCLVVTTVALAYSMISVRDNTFATGGVRINLNDGEPVIRPDEFLFEPGMTVKKDFFIENDSTGTVYYRLYFAGVSGDLADVLEVTVKDGNKTLYSGTPTQLENTQAADDLLAVGQRRTLTMYFHFPEATGNSAQAKDLTFTLCADATQTKNNPQRLFD